MPSGHVADSQQAAVFHALLVERRAAVCDRLDEQAVKLARYERLRDTSSARRKRLRIKEIGAELREIDRMIGVLEFRMGKGERLPARRSIWERRMTP